MTRPAKIFRWIVFLLAAGYCLRTLFLSDWSPFGGPFRFLTIWALFMSFFAASRMMALVEGRSTRRWDGWVSATAVINGMVVYLYWSLFLNDPRSVTRDGELGELYLELYLHGLGPLLQWIDAVFIHRAFRRPVAAIAWLTSLITVYILWIELIVAPLNATPRGTVTSGLPYPFLNSLLLDDRMVFYASNYSAAFVLLLAFTALGWCVSRALPSKAPADLTDNPGI